MKMFGTAAVTVALFCATVAAAPTAAHPIASSDFGSHGRVATIGGLNWPSGLEYTAVAGDGDVYVGATPEGGGEFGPVQVRRYLPDGKLDPSFGSDGAVVFDGLGGMDFRLSELLVDTNGLAYLIGTTFGPQTAFVAPYPLGAIRPGYATVARLTAKGVLDPTYGDAGVARFDFGLTAPNPPYEKPTVYGSRAVIDQGNRVLLVASEQEAEARGPTHSAFYEDARLVARLTPSGMLDTTFGDGGTAAIPSLSVDGFGVDEKGRAQLALPDASEDGKAFRLMRLDEDGRPDPSLGPTGVRTYKGIGAARALAVRYDGSTVVLGTASDPRHDGGVTVPLMTIGSRGIHAPEDRGGRRFEVHLQGHSYISEVAADPNGDDYLVGTQVTRPAGEKTWRHRRRQGLVVDLDDSRSLYDTFGRNQQVVVTSPADVLAKGVSFTDGGRRILVDGIARPRTGTATAHGFLAEYPAAERVITYELESAGGR